MSWPRFCFRLGGVLKILVKGFESGCEETGEAGGEAQSAFLSRMILFNLI